MTSLQAYDAHTLHVLCTDLCNRRRASFACSLQVLEKEHYKLLGISQPARRHQPVPLLSYQVNAQHNCYNQLRVYCKQPQRSVGTSEESSITDLTEARR